MPTILERERHPETYAPRDVVECDETGWRAAVAEAEDAGLLRSAFRGYLETYGHVESDFDAAELIFGELVGNCAHHAPGPLRIEFQWTDATLTVVDCCDRLRVWPFSPGDCSAESTYHGFAILRALCLRITIARQAGGGTRACVTLPVLKAAPVIR